MLEDYLWMLYNGVPRRRKGKVPKEESPDIILSADVGTRLVRYTGPNINTGAVRIIVYVF